MRLSLIPVDPTTIVFAFRYALGRRTGATTHMLNELRHVWMGLDFHTQRQIQHEICIAGKDCEMETWGEILTWTTHEDPNCCPHCHMVLHNCLCSHDD